MSRHDKSGRYQSGHVPTPDSPQSPGYAPQDDDFEEFAEFTEQLEAITQTLGRPEATGGKSGAGRSPLPTIESEFQQESAFADLPKKADGSAPALPHLLSKTTLVKNYRFRILFVISILVSFLYFAVRVIYLLTGKSDYQVPEGTPAEERQNLIELNRGYSATWSWFVLLAELGGFVLVHVGQQMFTKQKTKWSNMSPENIIRMAELVKQRGPLQRLHVMVCTYSEPMETVQACIQHLLDSPLPVYATRTIYVGDDGWTKPEAAAKREMVARFHEAGHRNVVYVGDRAKLPGQLNGKSSNLNHMILNKIYPHAQAVADISWKDILMVMDCDHLVVPSYFHKCCATMLDTKTAVCLCPQWFHNHFTPDFADNTNTNFMFRLMPYYFGAGCCFITGTNVMIRARPCFMACRFDDRPHEDEQAGQHRQLFSETLVAEDIDLGSRLHTLGFKSIFLSEVMAHGEVPHAPRDIWKQRSRWAKAAHLYVLDKDSVFWQKQEFMTFHQKSLYCIPLILHFILIWAEPIMFVMPIMCLRFDVCPYGMDLTLWLTHFFKLLVTFLVSTSADTWGDKLSALFAQTSSRVLFWVNVKAALNTLMIWGRWKRPGAFKVTAKAAATAEGVDRAVESGQELAVVPFTEGEMANAMVPPDFWGYADRYDPAQDVVSLREQPSAFIDADCEDDQVDEDYEDQESDTRDTDAARLRPAPTPAVAARSAGRLASARAPAGAVAESARGQGAADQRNNVGFLDSDSLDVIASPRRDAPLVVQTYPSAGANLGGTDTSAQLSPQIASGRGANPYHPGRPGGSGRSAFQNTRPRTQTMGRSIYRPANKHGQFNMYPIHDRLSQITELRKKCLPYDGALDVYVLLAITAVNIYAVYTGLDRLGTRGSILSLRGTEVDNTRMIAIIFALVEAAPGLLFLWYMVVYRWAVFTMKIWVPFVIVTISLLVCFIEFRVGFQYLTTALGLNWQLPDCEVGDCNVSKW